MWRSHLSQTLLRPAETCWAKTDGREMQVPGSPGTSGGQRIEESGRLMAHHQAKHTKFQLLFLLHFPQTLQRIHGLHKIPVVRAIHFAIWKILMSDLCRPSILSFFYFSTFQLKMENSITFLLLPEFPGKLTTGIRDLVYSGFNVW